MAKKTSRLAALSDVHYGRHARSATQELLAAASDAGDVLLLCGDLTDSGLPEEAKLLADDLRRHVNIPVLAVLGNHDFEAGKPEALRDIMEDVGVTLLDGEGVEIGGIGFAGVRGFGGGFGKRMVSAWGEPIIKQFVQEGVDEALKLEQALAKLQTEQLVVLLHYAPIRDTVEAEPPEIYPFLGSSRLEEPLNRFSVRAVFHGHAHHGSPEGRTSGNIPVYNVSVPVLRRAYPDQPPFRLVEVSVHER